MGSLIFGTNVVEGRSFDNIKIQTSRAGVPRPIIFGRARPVVGNIIATSPPRIVVVREEQEGGKGGPSVEVENEEVYRTYAIRICEGPVTGISRVWRNNEIIYDRDSQDATQQENNTAFLQKAEFFLGGYDQMPSAVLQAQFGIENVHGYRGTCYMVMDDENLTSAGGAIPQYAFEVERCEGFVLTSKPYAVEVTERIDPELSSVEQKYNPFNVDDVYTSFISITATMVSPLRSHDIEEPDEISAHFISLYGSMAGLISEYDNGEPDSVSAQLISVSGSMYSALIAYDEAEHDSVSSEFIEVTGTMT